MAYVKNQTGQDPWTAQLVWTTVVKREAVEPPPEEAWRLLYLAKLMAQRKQLHTLGMEEKEKEVQLHIDFLCISYSSTI